MNEEMIDDQNEKQGGLGCLQEGGGIGDFCSAGHVSVYLSICPSAFV